MSSIDQIVMGPALRALTDKRRRFVWAMVSNPFGTQADWAREAGYSDVGDGCKVRGHEVLQDPKVQAACLEISRATLGTIGPVLAANGLLKIAANEQHPQHVKALELIANRVGLHETQQIEVVHRDLTGDALLERIRMLAEKHGVSLGMPEPKVIEGAAIPISDGSARDG